MRRHALMPVAIAATLIAGVAATYAEVLDLRAEAEVRIEEIGPPSDRDRDIVRDRFPQTSDLPIQVVARLETQDPNMPAAGVVAAQFADPRSGAAENPQELAVNLALLSANPRIAYRAESMTVETRTVRFRVPATLPATGTPLRRPVRGLVTLDGAIAIFSPSAEAALSDAEVRIRMEVVQRDAGRERTVFSTEIVVSGDPNEAVGFEVVGDLPAERLVFVDLSGANPDFELFQVVVLPNIRVEYPYMAPVGESFDLEAKLTVQARNAPGSGVAVVLGAPQQALSQVVEVVRGKLAAERFGDSLKQARARAAGRVAAERTAVLTPLVPLTCGPIGLLQVGLIAVALGSSRIAVRRAKWGAAARRMSNEQ